MSRVDIARTRAYEKRLRHRANCSLWTRRQHCADCGYDLERFGSELLAELDDTGATA